MLKKCFVVMVSLCLAAVLAAGSGFAADEVKVGIMIPTTGGTATDGKDMESAIKLAVDEINAGGGLLGKTIVTTTGDDACDPQQAVAAASKLISEGVVGVVGGYCSSATLPTLALYGEAKVPFVITASNSTALVGANPGIGFMINSTGDAQADTAVALFESLGVKSIALSTWVKLTPKTSPRSPGPNGKKKATRLLPTRLSTRVSRISPPSLPPSSRRTPMRSSGRPTTQKARC
jgi:branched-chain amino acid transport system substrate-binding protein